ncbi:MAG: hypothetical protein IIA83_11045 [Thaumarchaeota archaeon]|nr:hypothetical protein [Nitrososphaerota archaeon]
MQITSYIDVHVPKKVTRGDLMVIYARFIDEKTRKLIKIPNVYLQIISTDDHEYWPTSLIKQNISVLHIAIGTLEMKDQKYIIKVSDHKEMMSFGFNRVKLRKPWGVFKNKKHPVKIQLC